jgi:hypothetical protein
MLVWLCVVVVTTLELVLHLLRDSLSFVGAVVMVVLIQSVIVMFVVAGVVVVGVVVWEVVV